MARYKRSVLGPFWLTLGTAIGVGGLGLLWSELLKVDRSSFIPSLTAGLIIWQFLAGCMTDSSTLFIKQASVIRNLQLPYFIHPIQLLMRHAINFAHNMLVFLAVVLLLNVPVNWNILWLVPGLVLVSANLLWIILLFGMLGARFRDFEYAVSSLVPLLFFISPVLYRPGYLPLAGQWIWMNPFSHFIELIRTPLLGSAPPDYVILTTALLAVAGWSITFMLFNARRNRIAYWV